MSLLKAMVAGQQAMMLKDIAAAADMPASKAHRYLVSLIRSGLVEQDPLSSRYTLGPFALNLGLVALGRLDRVRLGLSAIADLRDAINETTALAVWGGQGPVIVRWERPRRPITVNVITGATLSLLASAAGRVFAAWLPPAQIEPVLEAFPQAAVMVRAYDRRQVIALSEFDLAGVIREVHESATRMGGGCAVRAAPRASRHGRT